MFVQHILVGPCLNVEVLNKIMQKFDCSVSAAFDHISAPSLVQPLQRAGGQSAVTGGDMRRTRLTRSVQQALCSQIGIRLSQLSHNVFYTL